MDYTKYTRYKNKGLVSLQKAIEGDFEIVKTVYDEMGNTSNEITPLTLENVQAKRAALVKEIAEVDALINDLKAL